MASRNRWPSAPPPLFDVLTATADHVITALETRSITSRQLVESYLAQIKMHNLLGAKCNALMSLNSKRNLLRAADLLDEERSQGRLRGPLHGMPILINDDIAGLNWIMRPSLGSQYLLGSYGHTPWESYEPSSPVFETLAERGLIIMGKTNITEFKGMKGVPGYSMYGGMCQPAYIPSGYKLGEKPRGETSPGGSSTGSAVAVTCGFAPISIGTETSGCIASPAATAALYALKLTPGSVSMEGILELTACLDTLGTFGKTALDVALGCDALSTSSQGPTLASFVSSMKLQDVSVGFVDIEKWRLPAGTGNDDPKYLEQTAREYQQAKDMLRQSGVKVVDVYLTPPEERMIGGMNVTELIDKIIRCQGKNGIERFLECLQITSISTLDEIVEWNRKKDSCEFTTEYCSDQALLEALVAESRPDHDHEVLEWLEECKRWAATEGIDKVVSEQGVDVVVCCSDSNFTSVSVAARYPMAAVPLGFIESSGRPYGLQAVAQAHQEAKLVRFMAACERVFPPRRQPDLEACKKARPAYVGSSVVDPLLRDAYFMMGW